MPVVRVATALLPHCCPPPPPPQVTNLLLKSIDDIIAPAAPAAGGDRFAAYHKIVDLHRTLATEMGLPAAHYAPVEALLEDLKRLLDGILLTQEVSPRLRARVAAYGELLSSQLGVAYLVQHEGLNAVRVDSRTLLSCEVDDTRTEADTYLEADVRPTPQVKESEAAASGEPVAVVVVVAHACTRWCYHQTLRAAR